MQIWDVKQSTDTLEPMRSKLVSKTHLIDRLIDKLIDWMNFLSLFCTSLGQLTLTLDICALNWNMRCSFRVVQLWFFWYKTSCFYLWWIVLSTGIPMYIFCIQRWNLNPEMLRIKTFDYQMFSFKEWAVIPNCFIQFAVST